MTDAGWAEKVIEKAQRLKSPDDQFVRLPEYLVVRLLKAEHARSVRIVKAEINAVKRDRHNYSTTTRVEMVKRLEGLLAKFERGRGGKG